MISRRQQSSQPDKLLPMLIGASDGLVIPFVLSIALSAAGIAPLSIFLWTMLFILFSAVIHVIISYKVIHPSSRHKNADTAILHNMGLSNEELSLMQAASQDDEHEWTAKGGQGIEKIIDNRQRPFYAAYIGVGYFLAGLLSIFPYLILAPADSARIASVFITLICTVFVAMTRAWLLGTSALSAALRLSTIAMATAALIYYITQLFIHS